jgi:hypothetical protein
MNSFPNPGAVDINVTFRGISGGGPDKSDAAHLSVSARSLFAALATDSVTQYFPSA